MRGLLAALKGALITAPIFWLTGAGFWLVSETTYPFARSTVGAAALGAALGALVGFANEVVK
jgi:hypothetical protein